MLHAGAVGCVSGSRTVLWGGGTWCTRLPLKSLITVRVARSSYQHLNNGGAGSTHQ